MPSIVHYYGINSVISAYQAAEATGWALFTGKMLNAYDNDDDNGSALNELLTRLAPAGSMALYQLRFYKSDVDTIDEKTKYAGAFNFRLDVDQNSVAGIGTGHFSNAIEQRLQTLEAGQVGGDEKETIAEKIIGFINENEWTHPIVQGLASTLITKLGLQNIPGVATALAGVSEDDEVRIKTAVDLLKKRDPKFAEHITKIASMPDLVLNAVFNQLDQM